MKHFQVHTSIMHHLYTTQSHVSFLTLYKRVYLQINWRCGTSSRITWHFRPVLQGNVSLSPSGPILADFSAGSLSHRILLRAIQMYVFCSMGHVKILLILGGSHLLRKERRPPPNDRRGWGTWTGLAGCNFSRVPEYHWGTYPVRWCASPGVVR